MTPSFFKVAASVPSCRVADCVYNIREINQLVVEASERGVQLLVFPELSLTAYTCGDLFLQKHLLEQAERSLLDLLSLTSSLRLVVVVGMPIDAGTCLLNAAVVVQSGRILGVVPKTFLPNYAEFYEQRWFVSARDCTLQHITLCGQTVPMGTDLLFETPETCFGIELCEDLWAPVPPSSHLCLKGAEVILNLSATDECVGKHDYLCSLVAQQSARCVSAYVYASSGYGESSTDMVFAGNALVCENGSFLARSDRFSHEPQLVVSDVYLDLLRHDRRKNTTFHACSSCYVADSIRRVPVASTRSSSEMPLDRTISPHPFLPSDTSANSPLRDILSIQCEGLAKRIEHSQSQTVVIGVSGGLDSTLALLVCAETFDRLKRSRSGIIGVTMPGFGTTNRTRNNATQLMEELGLTVREISIAEACRKHFEDIGHDEACRDAVYENAQARERMQVLMDLANQCNGIVVGTGDMSELALGWTTYNGDHMSMYGVNSGIPKTLIRHLVAWVAEHRSSERVRAILMDIIDTPISPELLPADKNDQIEQKTEDLVGPYELHDFFLFYFMRYGLDPESILFLAKRAFHNRYDEACLNKWLSVFLRRFFSQQFKRSCMPDGPKVGSIAISPRGDWRMPSDASSYLWTKAIQ